MSLIWIFFIFVFCWIVFYFLQTYFRGLFKALKTSQLEFSLYLHKSHYKSKKKSTKEELQAALKMFLQNRKADLT